MTGSRWKTALGLVLAVAFGYGLAIVADFPSTLRITGGFSDFSDTCQEMASRNGWKNYTVGVHGIGSELHRYECLPSDDP